MAFSLPHGRPFASMCMRDLSAAVELGSSGFRRHRNQVSSLPLVFQPPLPLLLLLLLLWLL